MCHRPLTCFRALSRTCGEGSQFGAGCPVPFDRLQLQVGTPTIICLITDHAVKTCIGNFDQEWSTWTDSNRHIPCCECTTPEALAHCATQHNWQLYMQHARTAVSAHPRSLLDCAHGIGSIAKTVSTMHASQLKPCHCLCRQNPGAVAHNET